MRWPACASRPYTSSEAALVNAFVGKKVSSLRTPAFVVNKAIVTKNCAEMQKNASKWGARFRAHIKTHKTAEGVRHQVEVTDSDRAIVVSTLIEAWQVIKTGLVKDGTVKDILFGFPTPITKIPEILALKNELDGHGSCLRLIVDHPGQVSKLQAYAQANSASPWSIFVKVDPGYKRAGVVPGSVQFLDLLQSIQDTSSAIELYGFYCHAGNSYGSQSLSEASSFLSDEIKTVSEAARIATSRFGTTNDRKPFVLSVGSTPTAHVPSDASESESALAELRSSLGNNVLELHAGNYIFHDLQQLATSLISPSSIAFRVLATVVSIYPGRGLNGEDEALIDVGAIGLSKDTGPMEGYGKVVAIFPPAGGQNPRSSNKDGWLLDMDCGWTLARISQEHGILRQGSGGSAKLTVGSVVSIIGQHACLIAANHPWYYVVDFDGQGNAKDEEIVDIWVPWKGW